MHKENEEDKSGAISSQPGNTPPEISTEAEKEKKPVDTSPAVPIVKEEKKPKIDVSDQNTVYISFYKTSKEAGWAMFPKISSSPEQATNRLKAQISTFDVLVVPVDLP